jgi:hypothetical protein
MHNSHIPCNNHVTTSNYIMIRVSSHTSYNFKILISEVTQNLSFSNTTETNANIQFQHWSSPKCKGIFQILMVFRNSRNMSNFIFCSSRKQPKFNGFHDFGNQTNIGFHSLQKKPNSMASAISKNMSNIGFCSLRKQPNFNGFRHFGNNV